jgi:hypothetical protein
VKSVRQRQDERRDEKLKEVQRQIDEGSLVVRKMTKAERAAHPPRNRERRKRS